MTVRARESRADKPASGGAGSAPLSRLVLLDAILPHCEPDKACLQNELGQFAWLYSEKQVTSAVAAWREGKLRAKCFETSTKDGRRTFLFDRPVRLGLVPHKDGKVGTFMIDLDDHEGGKDTTGLLGHLERFFGTPAVVFTSKSGRGKHAVYLLKTPRPVRQFVKWVKAWGFNRDGRPEFFPKTHRLTQIWLPNEPNRAGGDTYVSGSLDKAILGELPPAPPMGMPDDALDFLMGFAEPGSRNDLLNRAAFVLGQRGYPEPRAEVLCRRGATLCDLDGDETGATFRSGFTAGMQSAPKAAAGENANALPCIQTNGRQLRDVVADAWSALHKANTGPSVFLRHGALAHLAWRRGVPVLEPMDQDLAYGQLARCGNWLRVNDTGDFVPTKPVREVARDMLAYPDPSLPPLEAVVTAPVFGGNGRLISEPGYHKEEALWLHLPDGFEPGEIPESPKHEDIETARLALVSELLGDFPFVSKSDLAHTVAAVVLPFARRLVAGVVPLHVTESPMPGSGKGLLCQLISIIATGEICASRTLPEDEDEVRKSVTSLLATSPALIVLDNVSDEHGGPRKRRIDSATLSSVLTAELWMDRILGQTRNITMPNRALWMLTANNPRLSMEIARRCVRIRLDPRTDRPWLRKNFKHPRIVEWTKENRSGLVRAVLLLVRAWQAAGSPLADACLGSFERWSAVMGGILEAAGIRGFLASQTEFYEAADAEGEVWRAFVAAWWDEYRDEPQKVAELNRLCERGDLMTAVRGDGTVRSQQTRLGASLQKARDRVFGNLTVTRYERSRHKGAFAWRLLPADERRAAIQTTLGGDLGNLGKMEIPTSPSLSPKDLRPGWGPWGPSARPTHRNSEGPDRSRGDVYGGAYSGKVPDVPTSDVSPCPPSAGTIGPARGHTSPKVPASTMPNERGVADAPSVRPDALPANVPDWPDDWRYAYEERAGVMEYDGGLPRDEAERTAEAGVRGLHAQAGGERR